MMSQGEISDSMSETSDDSLITAYKGVAAFQTRPLDFQQELPCDNTSGLSFRPFEVELWLLLVGYRHWIMVAMVQLLSAGRCDACEL